MRHALNPLKLLTATLLVTCCAMGAASAEEEESYYLEQMRNQSRAESGKPDLALPEQENGLLAETDLQELTKVDDDLGNITDTKPEFGKPKLDLFKPEL
jgi:hypothetical protein